MIALVLLILYCGIAAVGLVLCACAFLGDPSPRSLAEILARGVPLVLLWPFCVAWMLLANFVRIAAWLARRLSAR